MKNSLKKTINNKQKEEFNCQNRFSYVVTTILNETPKGTKMFRDVPDIVEIFISTFDFFKEGRMLYRINRTIEGSGKVVYNGMSEYYVNTAVKDRSTDGLSHIADLMEMFVESDRYDYEKFPKTSERKHQFKNTEDGVREMSEGIQMLIDNKEKETKVVDIMNVMEAFGVTVEKAMDSLKIPQDQRKVYAGLLQDR